MTNQMIHPSLRNVARMAGLLYLILFIAGIFAEGYVREYLIVVPGDAAATASNIVASEGLFRLGIAGELSEINPLCRSDMLPRIFQKLDKTRIMRQEDAV